MANGIAYDYPITGATAPTAAQSRRFNQVSAIITGDGSATTLTLTHNWNIPAAQLASNFPEYTVEPISGGAPPALEVLNTGPNGRTANAIAFTLSAATSAVFRVRMKRPFAPTQ